MRFIREYIFDQRGSDIGNTPHCTCINEKRQFERDPNSNIIDPLKCPKCGGEMKIISFIEEEAVIRKIKLPG